MMRSNTNTNNKNDFSKMITEDTTTPSSATIHSPTRLFISQIKISINSKDRSKENDISSKACIMKKEEVKEYNKRIRCLGTIVFIENNVIDKNSTNDNSNDICFIIDDGTGTLDIIMQDDFFLTITKYNYPKVGDIVDCIGNLIWIDSNSSYCPYLLLDYLNNSKNDDVHKETLRILEICSTITLNGNNNKENLIIGSNGNDCNNNNDDNIINNNSGHRLDKQDVFRVISSDYSRDGVEICELVLLFFNTDRYNCPGRSVIQEILNELQIDGAIYKDLNGRYFAL